MSRAHLSSRMLVPWTLALRLDGQVEKLPMAKLEIAKIASNKKVLAGIAVAAIVLVGGAAVMARGSGSEKPGKYTYEFAEIGKGDVSRVVSASGAVQPKERVDVGSEVSGKIVEVLVDFNDPVKKGQVLAQVDPETFQNTLDQNRARQRQSEASVANNKAAIDRAQVTLDTQTKNYTRTKALFAEGATSAAQMEQAEQTYQNAVLGLADAKVSLKSAEAGLETARATVQDSVTRLERTNIRSPLDGVIINRKLEVGQTVQSSQQIATLFVVAADLAEIEIEAAVVESDIGGIDNGDPAVFTVDAFPGERFNGTVSQVRKLGAEQANVVTYTVVVNARNPGNKLLPGMTANVEITADRQQNVLRIAEGATKFQPPKEIMDKFREQNGGANGQGGFPGAPGGGFGGPGGQGAPAAGGQGAPQVVVSGGEGQRGNGGGNRGPGGNRGGFGGQNNMMNEWLTAAGVDETRAKKITDEMQGEMQRMMASMPQPQQQQGGQIIGGGGFRRPASQHDPTATDAGTPRQDAADAGRGAEAQPFGSGIRLGPEASRGNAVAEARHGMEGQRQGRA